MYLKKKVFDMQNLPLFNFVKTGEIPPRIRRIQERCGFYPGEPLDHKNFLRLILVRKDEEKDPEEKKDGNSKGKMDGSTKANASEKSERDKNSAKDKAYNNWGSTKKSVPQSHGIRVEKGNPSGSGVFQKETLVKPKHSLIELNEQGKPLKKNKPLLHYTNKLVPTIDGIKLGSSSGSGVLQKEIVKPKHSLVGQNEERNPPKKTEPPVLYTNKLVPHIVEIKEESSSRSGMFQKEIMKPKHSKIGLHEDGNPSKKNEGYLHFAKKLAPPTDSTKKGNSGGSKGLHKEIVKPKHSLIRLYEEANTPKKNERHVHFS